ncbi:hypothetical protein OS493_011865 [Desmophyllum pertusum]|uniref:Uncharacterized protein n=1 Tax=Desmophyllum pertusum TaxID=174260 RepID=A0A9W9YE67_9CNID|nr:hypothetical protein OS493_011865 [Desmophyllum pertusum]
MKVLFTVIYIMAISMVRTEERCQLDTNTRAQLNKLFPMLLNLGVDLLKTKETIEKRWFKDSYESADIQFSVFPRQQRTNKTTPESTLEINCRILKAFISLISNFKRQFGAFSAARDVTHQLQEIKWKSGNINNFIQAIKNALKKPGHDQLRTAVIRPITSAAINSTRSFHGVRTSAQSSATARPSSTTLTLHGIALQASAMLDDFYSNIVIMQVDFMKVTKILCPKK